MNPQLGSASSYRSGTPVATGRPYIVSLNMTDRFQADRSRTAPEAIRSLVPGTEVADSSKQILSQLQLPRDAYERILFEMTCLQILGVHFAILESFEKEPAKLTALLDSYYGYWSVYSEAMAVKYGEEAYRRLPAYREALTGHGGSEPIYAVGKVFAACCQAAESALGALGSNVFASVLADASRVLSEMDIDFDEA